jgi:von Willebrand factor type A domain
MKRMAECSLAALLLTTVACGSDTPASGGGGSGATWGEGGSGGGSVECVRHDDCPQGSICTTNRTCMSASSACGTCEVGSYCSAVGECIAQGECRDNADCTESYTCDTVQGNCVPDFGCHAEEFDISGVPPNVLLVLDRTGSMAAPVPDSGGKNRWQVAQEAIAGLLSTFSGDIRFGLDVFSACTGGGCAPGTIIVPVGSDPETINQSIDSTELCNSGAPETVIGGTLSALLGEPSLQDSGRDNVILLITDGVDNCGSGGAQVAADLLAQTVPVETYVVGFSGDVDADELTSIAIAAGTAPYYQANELSSLKAALQAIGANVTTCTFALGSNPPEEDMYVFFNDDPTGIAEDGSNGYTYDESDNVITFHGAACDTIKDGTVNDIDVVFGCPAPSVR